MMNLKRLKEAEALFLNQYPGGFQNPEMLAIAKKHKIGKLVEMAGEDFSEAKFHNQDAIIQTMIKMITRSSMVSLFEKPKFRDFANSLNHQNRTILVQGMREQLHGNQEQGFNMVLDVLLSGKMAKWSLISIIPVYHKPHEEVFVKPTTAKGVIHYFEVDSLQYKPQPSWEFYKEYRSLITKMKSQVDPSLSPNNAAFTGFLMMSMGLL